MKISRQWLGEWVASDGSAKELGDRLTMAGFELESIAPAAPAFDGVVVAEIIEAVRHPQADKLQLCKVAVGDSAAARAAALQIVCGASNARVGLRTALATVGATLPGDLKIKAAKLRGVESAGMLCSARELGLSEAAEGILELPNDAPLGVSLRDYLALEDDILELSITPNRGDAMSVLGIAREVAAATGSALRPPVLEPVPPSKIDAALEQRGLARVDNPTACARFHGRVIIDIDNTRASPTWLRERLRRAGQRSISPVVDITNYIVLELGQPMHAYDLDKIEGELTARLARAGERCELLDGRTVELAEDVLVIADRVGPVALAGVMGGTRTAVSATSTRVLFEVAWFSPQAIAGRARRFGLTTDASQRFERGVDPELGAIAIERATRMLLEIAGGRAAAVKTFEDASALPPRPTIELRLSQVQRLLGTTLPSREVSALLERVGLAVQPGATGGDSLRVIAPTFRFDLRIERDLIEEVARLHGFERIPTARARATQRILPCASVRLEEQRMLDTLSARGWHEGVHFAFVDPALQEAMLPAVPAHRLANPIASDLAVMRLSLWPGLVRAALENQRRQQSRLRLFEHGVVFPVGAPERDSLAGIFVGTRWSEQWGAGRESGDFYDLRADVEALLALTGDLGAFRFVAERHASLHPGRSARILRDGDPVGWIGELHPRLARQLEFNVAPLLFELDTATALAVRGQPYREVSRFPQVRRDLAIVVDEAVTFEMVRERVLATASSVLREVVLFDVYRGPGVESGRKSIALGLILQDKDRTLSDEDIDRLMGSVRGAVSSGLNASFRE